MTHRNLLFLFAAIGIASLASVNKAHAAPPTRGFSDFQMQQSRQTGQRSPWDEAREGLKRIGVLMPLFKLCHTPVRLKAPYLELEKLLAKTAVARGVASTSETKRWIAQGAQQARLNWEQSQVEGANARLACLSIESELEEQKPLVEDTLRKLRRFAQENPPPKEK